MKEIFKRHPKFQHAPDEFDALPDNLWIRCPQCRELLYSREHEQAFRVCSKCKYHFTLLARERIDITVDEGSFQERDAGMRSADPLHFRSVGEPYAVKLEQYRRQADTNEAFIYGTATLESEPIVIGVSEFKFCGGTMGAVFGDKVVRAMELAGETDAPLVLFSSGGGARMQEGVISLMQMAKTVAGLQHFKATGLPFLSIMTDNCLGGITASYAMLGDVNIAEPGAYIGFAGRRVIEQTMRQKLPQEAATAEFLQQHGMVDMVLTRAELPAMLARLVRMLVAGKKSIQRPELVAHRA